MSEFKFACPVCGQHITADSHAAGSQLSCPTCFRKIVVPQAPTSSDPKFILSAAEVNKPRPPSAVVAAAAKPPPAQPARNPVPLALVAAVVLICAAGTTLFLFRGKFFKPPPASEEVEADPTADQSVTNDPGIVPPSNTAWTLDLSGTTFPDGSASGKIHGRDFLCGRAVLQGGTLTLRHGRGNSTELGLNIYLSANQAEELIGRRFNVATNNPFAPWVVLRWREGREAKKETLKGNYALKLEFGAVTAGRIPGKIYLCLTDAAQSCVAGTFSAEIRRPAPPKVQPPKPATGN